MKHSSITRSFYAALGVFILLGAGCRGGGHPPTEPTEDPTALFGSTATSTARRPDPADSTSPTGIGCNHEYYPLRLGYHIQYQTTYPPSRGVSGFGLYAIAVRTLADDRVQLQNVVDAGDGGPPSYLDFGYICRGGALMATGYVEAGSLLPGEPDRRRSKVQTDSSSGEFLPVHISPGKTWASEFNVKISPAEGSAPDEFGSDTAIRVPVKIVRTAIGIESVTVPAGTFQAMKIKTTTSFNRTIAMSGTEWWVKEVGMVKATYDGGSGTENIVTVARGVTVPGYIDIPSGEVTSTRH